LVPSPVTKAVPSCSANAACTSSAIHWSMLTAESSSSVWVAAGMA
jgi:hypothetical protein